MKHIDLRLQAPAVGVETTAKVHELRHVQHMDVEKGTTTQVSSRWAKGNTEFQGLCFGFDVGKNVLELKSHVLEVNL